MTSQDATVLGAREPDSSFLADMYSAIVHAVRALSRKRMGLISAIFIVFLFILSVGAPWIAPYDPLESNPAERLQGPSTAFWLGNDQIGRDVLSRLIYGARQSMYIGLISIAATTAVGTAIGLVSGYLGGTFDLIVQRVVDGFQALPGLILAMALISILGAGQYQVILAISVIITPSYSRVVRSAVLPIMQSEYVEAARALGATTPRMILRHVLPNIVAPILVLVSINFGLAVLIEGSLSFLGLGTPAPNPSWGNMIGGDARLYLERQPLLSLWPGLAIMLSVLAFNLLGDSLRDILDPRLRGSQ